MASSGSVEADIDAHSVEISGRSTGDLNAVDKIQLNSQCRVVGDVSAQRILIADGASFKGNVNMEV